MIYIADPNIPEDEQILRYTTLAGLNVRLYKGSINDIPLDIEGYIIARYSYTHSLYIKQVIQCRYGTVPIMFEETGHVHNTLIISNGFQYYDLRYHDQIDMKSLKVDGNMVEKLRSMGKNICKYKQSSDDTIEVSTIKRLNNRHLVLLQVPTDNSISFSIHSPSYSQIYGLIKSMYPDSSIIVKPHPRYVKYEKSPLISHIVQKVSLHTLLSLCHNIHTICSGGGIEAIINGNTVHTYGTSIYSHRGITIDHLEYPNVNRTSCSIDQFLTFFYGHLHRFRPSMNVALSEHISR